MDLLCAQLVLERSSSAVAGHAERGLLVRTLVKIPATLAAGQRRVEVAGHEEATCLPLAIEASSLDAQDRDALAVFC